MKTKTILLAGLIGAASALSSMAQVYSVNVVGFVNVTCPPGFTMISNPLVATDNTVNGLISGVPFGTGVYKFQPLSGQFAFNQYGGTPGSWTDKTMTMMPGEGVFIQNNGNTPFTITFVGTVQSGALSLGLGAGFSIISSQTPQQGLLDDTTANGLNFPLANGDTFYFFNTTTHGYDTYQFFLNQWSFSPAVGSTTTGGIGSSSAPQVGVGQAFWIRKASSANWNRTFSTTTQ